jgi:hypothetical protein
MITALSSNPKATTETVKLNRGILGITDIQISSATLEGVYAPQPSWQLIIGGCPQGYLKFNGVAKVSTKLICGTLDFTNVSKRLGTLKDNDPSGSVLLWCWQGQLHFGGYTWGHFEFLPRCTYNNT